MDSAPELPHNQDNLRCLWCEGSGEVSGAVDDVEFVFECICVGGNEEAIRWLLGSAAKDLPDKVWII